MIFILIVEVMALVNIFLYVSPITFGPNSRNEKGNGFQTSTSSTQQQSTGLNTQVQQIHSLKTLSQANQLLKSTFTGFLNFGSQKNNPAVDYYYSSSGSSIAFTTSKITFEQSLSSNSGVTKPVQFSLTFAGSNAVKPDGVTQLPHMTNYFIGSIHETNIPSFSEIWYYNLYPHIDLRFYMSANGLKYEFIVNPGGNPSLIHVQATGNVKLTTTNNAVNFYSSTDPTRLIMSDSGLNVFQSNGLTIPANFKISASSVTNDYSFHIGNYDHSQSLILDPTLLGFSTYFGGSREESASDIAIDSAGNIYIIGNTNSTNFPVYHAYNSTLGGTNDTYWFADVIGGDLFVAKFSPTGNLVYSTFLGGNRDDYAEGIAVDSSGNVFVTGITYSQNFPLYKPYNNTWFYHSDSFLTELNSSGSGLVFSTFTGEGTTDNSITTLPTFKLVALDSNGNCYIVNSVNGSSGDLFMDEFNSTGNLVNYGLIPGYGYIYVTPSAIAVSNNGNSIYVVGSTSSTDLQYDSGRYDSTLNGSSDGFIYKLNPLFSHSNLLLWGTYLGGNSSDSITRVAIDSQGNVVVVGGTSSTDFPTTQNSYDKSLNGKDDGFIAKITSDGTKLVYSTLFGGSENDFATGMTLADDNNIYISGATSSLDFPLKNAIDNTFRGGTSFGLDAFVARFNFQMNSFVYSTYLGGTGDDFATGIAVNSNGTSYTIGTTSSTDFPVQNAYQTTNHGGSFFGYDAFITQLFSPSIPLPTIALISPSNTSVDKSNTLIDFNISSSGFPIKNVMYSWDTGANISLASPYKLPLTGSDGAHILNIYATDVADDSIHMDYKFVIDNTPPTITLLSPSNSAIEPSGTAIKLNITDLNGVAKAFYQWDNDSKNITLASPYTVSLVTGNGQHILQIFAEDVAGNWATVTYQFTTNDSSSTQFINNVLTIIATLIAIAIPVTGFVYWRSLSLRYRKLIKDYVINDMSIEDLSSKYHKSHRQIEEILRKTKKMS